MSVFQLEIPLPARGSVEALRDRLIDHLVKTAPPVGARFLSDSELTRITKLSRPTVRRALDSLSREGWIERRHGSGTFVGPRVAMPEMTRDGGMGTPRRTVRLAVLVHALGESHRDWYSHGVIAGIDQVAYDQAVSIELLGDQDGEIQRMSRRLMQSHPDVLAFIAPSAIHMPILGECQRLGIPCIGTGTYLETVRVPTVAEDGVQGAAMAVRHLVEQGHRRIGLAMIPMGVPWVFQRRRGYVNGLIEAGIKPDEGLVHWVGDGDPEEETRNLADYLDSRKPTAVLFGNYGRLRYLHPLIRQGKLRVPQDLSVVTFDQSPECAHWLDGVKPAVVALPLAEMGQRLAEMARALFEKKAVAPATHLPCELRIGESVAPLRA